MDRTIDWGSIRCARSVPLMVGALLLGLPAFSSGAATNSASPRLRRVPQDYQTIQSAVTAASAGDVVAILPGTYVEDVAGIDLPLTLLPQPGPGAETGRPVTIRGTGSCTVLTIDPVDEGEVALIGLRITGGHSKWSAGGIDCRGAALTLRRCSVDANRSSLGGGGIKVVDAALEIEDCEITNNELRGLWDSSARGAGVYASSSIVRIRRSSVDGNSIEIRQVADGVETLGAGLCAVDCELDVRESSFSHNVGRTDVVRGAGVHVDGGSASFHDVRIDWNIARATNTAENTAPDGSVLRFWSPCRAELAHCTVVGNRASSPTGSWVAATDRSAGQLLDGDTSLRLVGTIVWNNGPKMVQGPDDAIIGWSLLPGVHVGPGNITGDPRLASGARALPYLLLPGSPCIDAGPPARQDAIFDSHPRWPEDIPNGARADMGAYGGPGNDIWRALIGESGGVPPIFLLEPLPFQMVDVENM